MTAVASGSGEAASTVRGEAYESRRAWIQHYFDRTASAAWARLTSDAPVSGIRKTVREGRDRMRGTFVEWLPDDLTGRRILDAGCGPGQLAILLARAGADVVAIDLAASLVDVARERLPGDLGRGSVTFLAGDMLDASLGEFDHVVAMDSLIHYAMPEVLAALGALAPRVRRSIVFTFAPGTPLLRTMRAVGRLFPQGDRAPAIEPHGEARLRREIQAAPALRGWVSARTRRVQRGFYTSQAMELVRA